MNAAANLTLAVLTFLAGTSLASTASAQSIPPTASPTRVSKVAPPPPSSSPTSRIKTAPPPVLRSRNGPQADYQQPSSDQFTALAFKVSTGGDDLRSDSSATVSLTFPDSSSQTCTLKALGGDTWDNNTTNNAPQCVLKAPMTYDQLKATKIILSYVGLADPGQGDPLHTWDNWDVNEVRVDAQNSVKHVQACLIDASSSPYLVRMTGDQSRYELSAAPSSC